MQMMFALREWFTRRFSRICSMHEIYPIYLKARGRRKMIQGQRAKYPNFWPTSHVNAPLLYHCHERYLLPSACLLLHSLHSIPLA